MRLWKLSPPARRDPVPAHGAIVINWQRLVDEHGGTCPRCAGTQDELDLAAGRLRAALAPLGFDVRLDEAMLDRTAFDRDPLDSNRIRIDGTPLEDLVGARTGASACCDACGDADCRTVETAGAVHETIPADLIVAAGLYAAARRLAALPH